MGLNRQTLFLITKAIETLEKLEFEHIGKGFQFQFLDCLVLANDVKNSNTGKVRLVFYFSGYEYSLIVIGQNKSAKAIYIPRSYPEIPDLNMIRTDQLLRYYDEGKVVELDLDSRQSLNHFIAHGKRTNIYEVVTKAVREAEKVQ
jgi:hypothetical protein